MESHEREVRLNEAKAKINALEEKVRTPMLLVIRSHSHHAVDALMSCGLPPRQVLSQAEMLEQHKSRARDLETSARQLDSRCNDLKEAASSSELRAKDAQAEVLKGNQVIEKLMVRGSRGCGAACVPALTVEGTSYM